MAGNLVLVDAFADRPFHGNPAAVCFLPKRAEAAWMQELATELNLSETAFVVPAEDGFGLRWFTPRTEVELCGHATLAAAHALWTEGWAPEGPLRFHTRSGVLECTRRGALIALDFPATPAKPCAPPATLFAALGIADAVLVARTPFDLMVVLASGAEVRALAPDFAALGLLAARGIGVTAPTDDPKYDFVSRFFAPAAGINEDPVTGSAHCCLAPYWGERLAKRDLVGYQASRRGGVVRAEWRGDRVTLLGTAVTVVRGELA